MTSQPAMTIAVEFEVRQNTPARWLEAWGIRARDALDFEPTTTAYEAAIALDDPKRVLVFERYEGGESTMYEHMDRAAHKTLMETMQAERLTKRRPWIAMGHEVEGCPWQLDQTAAQGIDGAGAIIEITVLRSTESTQLLEICLTHAQDLLSSDQGMLLHGLSSVSMEDHNDYEINVGDYVISQVFKNRSAYDMHIASAEFSNLLAVAEGEVLFSGAYATTGCGFVWKGERASS